MSKIKNFSLIPTSWYYLPKIPITAVEQKLGPGPLHGVEPADAPDEDALLEIPYQIDFPVKVVIQRKEEIADLSVDYYVHIERL